MFIVVSNIGTSVPAWGDVILSMSVVSTHVEKPRTAPNGAEWNVLGTVVPESNPMVGVTQWYRVIEVSDPV